MSTFVYLTRHGITPANRQNRFAGRTGESLHPDGIVQLERVATGLLSKQVEAVYCGPLPRTRQSAEIISRITGVPVIIREGFNEIYLPHWDGLSKDEIRARHGDEYPTWLASPQDFALPSCETLAEVQARSVKALEEIFGSHAGGGVVVVSHLIVVRLLILHYRGLAIKDFRSLEVANGSTITLERDLAGSTQVSPAESG